MAAHRLPLDAAIARALAVLESPIATLYNTEGHIAIHGPDGTTSVNVWHCPVLRKDGATKIHGHQYHGCSTILFGELVNSTYAEDDAGDEVELVAMMPGEWTPRGERRVKLTAVTETHGQGASYCVGFDDLHLALTPGLAITLFRRTEVDLSDPIWMQVGGRLGTGGINWTPAPEFSELLPRINFATRALLRDTGGAAGALEELLSVASARVEPSILAPE
jgi:hypothetical protein